MAESKNPGPFFVETDSQDNPFRPESQVPPSKSARVLLLASVFVVAACGIVYELVAGALSSYLLGDAVTQFSLVIGVFLSAMGLGSHLSRYIQRDLLRAFIEIEVAVGLIGGLSSILLFATSALLQAWFIPVFYLLCVAVGTLVGLEIPLLVRILRGDGRLADALGNVLSLDYLGALAGSLAFPLLVLPFVGLSRASVVFGLLNVFVGSLGLGLLPRRHTGLTLRVILSGAILLGALGVSGRLVGFFEDMLYQDDVILAESTPYQRIILTRWRDDLRLYLDGNIQFSSVDEARYHESLVIPAMEAVPGGARDVLILGGGDGLAAREVLRYSTVLSVTLVDIDPAMTELGRSRPEFVALNKGSLSDPRVRVFNEDAMRFVSDTSDSYDAILVDLPDPNNESLARLYSDSFYALLARRLREHGVLVTQATSPFYAPAAFWCIVDTLASVNSHELAQGIPHPREFQVYPYHAWVPAFGDWGFVLASFLDLDPQALSPTHPTRYLTKDVIRSMFVFPADSMRPPGIEPNRLDRPILYEHYKRGWRKFNR